MAESRKYGVETRIYFPLIDFGATDFQSGVAIASGDAKISKDGGAFTNVVGEATNALFVDEGNGMYSLKVVIAELQCAVAVILIVDQDSPKEWEDQAILIDTYGHVSAQHAFDLDTAIQEVNLKQISGDSGAADNLEAQYDGTGLAGDTYPATQAQLSNIANVGSAVNTTAKSYTLTTGTQSDNTYTDTAALDSVRHTHTDVGNVMVLEYVFSVGSGIPSSVTITGALTGINDDLEVLAYDYIAGSYVQIGVLAGKPSNANEVNTYNLFTSMVGMGASLGEVKIKFQDGAYTLSTATLYIDQIYVSFSAASSGYELGAIWVDDSVTNEGTVIGIDGVATNPVSTWAAALTLSAATNLERFQIASGTSIQLTANSDNYYLHGVEFSVDLNSQSIANANFIGALVTGTSAGLNARFHNCRMGTVSLTTCSMQTCAFTSNITLLSAGTYLLDNCFSGVAGTATPRIDFGVALGNTNLNMRHYSGGIEIENMGDAGTDNMSLEGFGQLIINASCDGGTIAIRGNFTITDNVNGGFAGTISDDARYDTTQIADQVPSASIASILTTVNHTDYGNAKLVRSTTPANTVNITGGIVESNLKKINDNSVTDNTATLKLKQLDIQNFEGTAVIMKSTGSNGIGLDVAGNGSGHASNFVAGATGSGMYIKGGATGGHGLVCFGLDSAGHGIFTAGGATSGHGIMCSGGGSGSGLFCTAGATGHGIVGHGGVTTGHGMICVGGGIGNGIECVGGDTSGDGFNAAAPIDGNGMTLTGATNGNGLECIKAGSGADIAADIDGTLTTVTTVTTVTNGALTGSDGDTLESLSDQIDAIPGTGEGSVSVDHDYGGSDNLTAQTQAGAGIDNVYIRAFLKADYDAGSMSEASVKDISRTDVNGQWENPMRLDPATYTLQYSKQGYYQTNTKEVTVT